MEIRVGAAKVPKFGHMESGDSLELVERPHGGLTVVMADGQGSGRPAKRISSLVVGRAVSLIVDGARDGAVARAVHDILYALRDGRVSCTLTVLSVDLRTRTIVISRNGAAPVLAWCGGRLEVIGEDSAPIGVREATRPAIRELPLAEDTTLVAFTDGVTNSGRRLEDQFDLERDAVAVIRKLGPHQATRVAESILGRAVQLDDGQPADDMSVVVLSVARSIGSGVADRMRTMSVFIPV